MNHEIIKKSIGNQSKQRADNGDILDERTQERATTNIFLPKHISRATFPPPPTPKGFSLLSKQSFYFYAATRVVLALCCLTTPTIAHENIIQPLPL